MRTSTIGSAQANAWLHALGHDLPEELIILPEDGPKRAKAPRKPMRTTQPMEQLLEAYPNPAATNQWLVYQLPDGVINGFLARFSGADRSLAWSTYVAGTDMNDIRTLYFDELGNLYVAGRTRDLSFPLRDLSGMFFSNSIETDIFQGLFPEESDLFIMSFTPDHWLAWASYFGGEAGTTHEGLFTLLRRNGDIYAAGFTTKSIVHWVGPFFESFFPLHDPQVPGVHFEEHYGDVPDFQGNPTADAFITRFCASPLTFTPERETAAQPLLHAWQHGNQIAVAGLPAGTHRALVTDAAGRVVGQLKATSDGQLGTLRTLPWAEGTYILVFPELGRQARLFINR
jgi:hypothetical protein